jgi:hypothetical protein
MSTPGPLSGVKRKLVFGADTSVFDPKPTLSQSGTLGEAYRAGPSSSLELLNRSSRASFEAWYAIEQYEPDTRHR